MALVSVLDGNLHVITHIDEYWGKSYAYYQELEKSLDGIFFAYDGMVMEL